MDSKAAFGKALKKARDVRRHTQEDFGEGSSRTYISAIERGIYSPTVDKLMTFSKILDLHPLTLIALTCKELEPGLTDNELLERLSFELASFNGKLD